MTDDLVYLAWTALLTAALWIPYITGQVISNGFLQPVNYQDPTPRPVPLWAKRANRAHLNAVEAFAPFAALVLTINVTGQANEATAMWASLFLWSRLGPAVAYLFAIPYVRTLIFVAGFVAVAGLFYEVIS
jgi:uncharacterized MAPEG superfamily protein